ncbi:hypothetical protein [Aquisphaera insulae]|uniref:hypothetical protein n=1 Tax=Aquisphaera insulae TaxID=2712864 RepID=UPI0013EA703B|nr:hypothetical protein [Aquisphaera insulae]
MKREPEDRREEREADTAREFRCFLTTYRSAISLAAQGESGETVSIHANNARLHGRDVLARLFGREPTEVETLIRF